MTEKIDLDARYRVESMPGVAFWIKRLEMERPECDGHPCDDAPDLFSHSGIGEIFYCDGTCQDFEWTGMLVMVMVGDNREHIIDADDIVKLDDDDYCSVCGQIGCGHDGRDRD